MQADSRRNSHDQRGLTLVELIVTTLLLGIVMAICVQVFITIGRTVTTIDQSSQNTDQARLAVQQIDRQIRSGNVLYDPLKEGLLADGVTPDPVAVAAGINPGFAIRVYTQANGDQRCVQWRITKSTPGVKDGVLQTRSWSEAWVYDGDVSGWRNVAENLLTLTGNPAFKIDTSVADFGGRLINIDVRVNADPAHQKTVQFTSSVTGRNTEYGYSQNICSSIPPA